MDGFLIRTRKYYYYSWTAQVSKEENQKLDYNHRERFENSIIFQNERRIYWPKIPETINRNTSNCISFIGIHFWKKILLNVCYV